MTIRSVIIGLVFGALIAAFGFYNDFYLRLNFIVGNHFPIIVFGGIIAVMLLINPLVALLSPSLKFRSSELAIIMALVLAACSVPGSGLMRLFPTSLAAPMHQQKMNLGWEQNELVSYVPDHLLPNEGQMTGEGYRLTIGGFIKGLNIRDEADRPVDVTLGDVPWGGWSSALWSWMPLIAVCLVGAIALAVVVHRQWSTHERLRYPIANVASMFIEQDEGRFFGPLYRNRLFWLGTGMVLFVHLVNGLNAWEVWQFKIDTTFPLGTIIYQKYPSWGTIPGAQYVFTWKIFPVVIGISYFLASDVVFSLGISKYALLIILLPIVTAGGDLSGNYIAGSPMGMVTFGGYVGVALTLLYTGRNYYKRVFKTAFLFRRDSEIESTSTWGARVFAVCAVAMVLLLWLVFELDLMLTIPVVALVYLMYLVMSRIIAETGLFFIQSEWLPFIIIAAFFGAAGLGPTQFIILGLVSIVLTGDPRETLMPFVINALKIGEDNKVRPGRTGVASGASLLLALAVAVPAVLWMHYQFGLSKDGWGTGAPKLLYEAMDKQVDTLKRQDMLAEAEDTSGLDRFDQMQFDTKLMGAAGIGLVAVLAFSFMRLRYTWWPIHPIIFLVWYTFPINHFHFSFLLGWLIKAAVTKIGGIQTYRSGRPLMVGLIAGDLLGGLVFNTGGIIYALMDIQQEAYNVLPG
ncbi:MAG: hypothetical protein GVY16_11570 [Planctomycetes bacterium]|jgi:hypothetical protein|nr:hypothetical protein [Phycisphaerae bacterium]NBB96362.1 hypothetical protein [Planctomycetota bacterium]